MAAKRSTTATGKAKAGSHRCRNCSAPHGGAYSAHLCPDCLLKATRDRVRLLAGQYVCAACNGDIATDAYGGIRCEHWCFTADARAFG